MGYEPNGYQGVSDGDGGGSGGVAVGVGVGVRGNRPFEQGCRGLGGEFSPVTPSQPIE